MKHQGVPVLYASISLGYFEAEKDFFVSMLRLRKKYAMLIKKRAYSNTASSVFSRFRESYMQSRAEA